MNEDEIDKLDQYMYDVAERRFPEGQTSEANKLVYLEAVEDVLSYLRGEPYTLEEDKDTRFPQAQAKTYRDIEGDLWEESEVYPDSLRLVTDDNYVLVLSRVQVEEEFGPLELALETL